MNSLFFFIIALSLLVVVHEFGHYWVARRCGVKVLKFSVGFGQPLWKKKSSSGTEYILAAIPLGGYVKMLDEREGPVPDGQKHESFNRKSLAARTAIIAAGPIANLLFAVFAYWIIFVSGIDGIRPLIGEIEAGSPAAYSQFSVGDEIRQVNGQDTPTWLSVRKALVSLSQSSDIADITVKSGGIEIKRQLEVQLDQSAEKPLLQQLGFTPLQIDLKPVIGTISRNGAADQSGLEVGDILYSFEGNIISNWMGWVDIIQSHPNNAMEIVIDRDGKLKTLSITPEKTAHNTGRIGVSVDASQTDIPEHLQASLHYGPFVAIKYAVQEVWTFSSETIKNLAGMLIGTVSSKNIGGPIAIAQFAGASADQGLIAFISFLAMISVSLGVLNLLPIPILDGGHLAMNLVEWLRGGKPLSEQSQLQGQKIGIVLLLSLMCLAFFNDLSRFFGF